MDRLSLVVLLGLVACDGGDSKPAAPPRSRVDVVTAAPKKEADPAQFCEERPNKPFAYPELDTPAPAGGRWRWVNVWATWCGPCVEEMPRLATWESKLVAEGTDVDVQFLSVDATAEEVTKFRASHPTTPEGVRMKDAANLSPWLASVGLDDTAVLPIHMFVDPQDQIRCVRMGAVGDADYDVIKKVLAGG